MASVDLVPQHRKRDGLMALVCKASASASETHHQEWNHVAVARSLWLAIVGASNGKHGTASISLITFDIAEPISCYHHAR